MRVTVAVSSSTRAASRQSSSGRTPPLSPRRRSMIVPASLSTTIASGEISPDTSASPRPQLALMSTSSKSLVPGLRENATPAVSLATWRCTMTAMAGEGSSNPISRLYSNTRASRQDRKHSRTAGSSPSGATLSTASYSPANEAPARSSSGDEERTAYDPPPNRARAWSSAACCSEPSGRLAAKSFACPQVRSSRSRSTRVGCVERMSPKAARADCHAGPDSTSRIHGAKNVVHSTKPSGTLKSACRSRMSDAALPPTSARAAGSSVDSGICMAPRAPALEAPAFRATRSPRAPDTSQGHPDSRR